MKTKLADDGVRLRAARVGIPAPLMRKAAVFGASVHVQRLCSEPHRIEADQRSSSHIQVPSLLVADAGQRGFKVNAPRCRSIFTMSACAVTHLESIFKKLDCKSRDAGTLRASLLGLL